VIVESIVKGKSHPILMKKNPMKSTKRVHVVYYTKSIQKACVCDYGSWVVNNIKMSHVRDFGRWSYVKILGPSRGSPHVEIYYKK
jgi:elongation factor P hydroxylase